VELLQAWHCWLVTLPGPSICSQQTPCQNWRYATMVPQSVDHCPKRTFQLPPTHVHQEATVVQSRWQTVPQPCYVGSKTAGSLMFAFLIAGLWSRSPDVSTSCLFSRQIVNVSVSAIYVSCPRPIFGQTAGHSKQCEWALDFVNLCCSYIAHHINTLKTMNVKDNI